jgi:hypothetical protein
MKKNFYMSIVGTQSELARKIKTKCIIKELRCLIKKLSEYNINNVQPKIINVHNK